MTEQLEQPFGSILAMLEAEFTLVNESQTELKVSIERKKGIGTKGTGHGSARSQGAG